MIAEEPAGEALSPPTERVTVAPIYNRFLFVDIAALRAKQLRRGAMPRLEPPAADPVTGHRPELPHKAERIAMEEVKSGLVPFEAPGYKPPAEAKP